MPLTAEIRARLARIGWRDDAAASDVLAPELGLGRVIAQHRNGYVVHDGVEQHNAQPAPKFLKRDLDPVERPAVGDFVEVKPGKPLQIERVLPRRTTITRAAAGERYQRQLIATNVDHVLVLMGLDGDFNPRRLERYLLLVRGSGAQAVIVLTKADTLPDPAIAVEAVRSVVPEDTLVVAVNAKDLTSLAPLADCFAPGHTGVLVGSSGAGKSTLTNTLLGIERQATGAVRGHDSRGRHTTTHRALLQLPTGGCLIDTPGMREIKFTGEEELEESSFTDIEALALECRFGDCAHGSEPGCAVRAALDAGSLDAARWDSYVKLRGELAAASDSLESQLKRKGQAKVANKALGRRLADKYGRR